MFSLAVWVDVCWLQRKKNPQNKQQKQYIFGGEDVTCNGDPPTVREEEDGINDLFLS